MVSFFFSVAKKNWEYSERQIIQRRQNPYLESSSSSSPTLSSSERKATYPLSFLLSFLSKTSSSRSAINTAHCYYSSRKSSYGELTTRKFLIWKQIISIYSCPWLYIRHVWFQTLSQFSTVKIQGEATKLRCYDNKNKFRAKATLCWLFGCLRGKSFYKNLQPQLPILLDLDNTCNISACYINCRR